MLVSDIENARFNMIEQQIRPVEVIDERALNTLRQIPREHFVPDAYQGVAFADIHVPLSATANMMKPVQEGLMLQALDIQPGAEVLEIGTGSGFISACLAHLGARKVTSIEIDPDLAIQAQRKLQAAGFTRVEVLTDDFFAHDFLGKQFDIIAVTGSLPIQTAIVTDLLAPGGRLFQVLGTAPVMRATLTERTVKGELLSESLFETLLEPLQNAPQPNAFVF